MTWLPNSRMFALAGVSLAVVLGAIIAIAVLHTGPSPVLTGPLNVGPAGHRLAVLTPVRPGQSYAWAGAVVNNPTSQPIVIDKVVVLTATPALVKKIMAADMSRYHVLGVPDWPGEKVVPGELTKIEGAVVRPHHRGDFGVAVEAGGFRAGCLSSRAGGFLLPHR